MSGLNVAVCLNGSGLTSELKPFFFFEGHRRIQSIQHHRLSVESSDQLWRWNCKKVYNHQTKTGWKLRGSKVTELVLPTKKCWWENLFQPFLTIQLMIISQLLLSDHFWCFIRNLFRGENGEEWRFHLDHQKVTWAVFSSPWLVVWYRGWNPTQLYGDYNKPI